jgi:16S rRNA (cytidine1402-2'-O)-methyltransferase
VQVVPGPAAVTAAMALAGVEAAGFVFGGFLPARPAAARAAALKRLVEAAGALSLPLILYESPHRVARLLSAIAGQAPQAQVAIGRELTKRHEQVLVGTAAEVQAQLAERRGEFTLVVSGLPSPPRSDGPDLGRLLAAGRQAGLPDRTLVELLRALGRSRRDAYRLVSEDPSVSAD